MDSSADADAVTATSDDAPSRRRTGSGRWLAVLVLLLLIVAGGWYGWRWWQQHRLVDAAQRDAAMQVEALAGRVDAMRGDQRAQAQRLRQAEATNRVLRDELLGLGERSAIIEDSFARLSDPERQGAQAMRLDEAELLLSLGLARLQVSGDLDGARRAYALAAGVLEDVDDPAYLSLHQTLAQERAALDSIDVEPRVRALAGLDTWVQSLSTPERRDAAPAADEQPWWRRAFASIVQVAPTEGAVALQPADITAARAGLELEISLARAAAERRDEAGWRTALGRAGRWLSRLPAGDRALLRERNELDALTAMPLSLSLPTLGTTIGQLRQLRAAH